MKVLIVKSRREGGNNDGGGLTNSFQDTRCVVPNSGNENVAREQCDCLPMPCLERARVMRWGRCVVMGNGDGDAQDCRRGSGLSKCPGKGVLELKGWSDGRGTWARAATIGRSATLSK